MMFAGCAPATAPLETESFPTVVRTGVSPSASDGGSVIFLVRHGRTVATTRIVQ